MLCHGAHHPVEGLTAPAKIILGQAALHCKGWDALAHKLLQPPSSEWRPLRMSKAEALSLSMNLGTIVPQHYHSQDLTRCSEPHGQPLGRLVAPIHLKPGNLPAATLNTKNLCHLITAL